MQIGDPKKTVVLAIVAVGAIGFCFKQLTGGGESPKALRTAEGTAAADASGGQPQANATLAVITLDQLRNDAFSHPKLASKGSTNQTGPVPPPANQGDGGAASGGNKESGTSLPGPVGAGPIDKHIDPNWPVLVNPNSPNVKPDGVQIQKITQVSLKAIVKVGQRIAYISIDGQEARGFHAGDLIKDDISVAFVNDDSVIVKSGTKTVTLKVGQQGDL